MTSKVWKFLKLHRRIALLVAVLIVSGVTALSLSLPATTATPQLVCGKEEHTHSSDCYLETTTLICGHSENQTESDPHEHSESCYRTERTLNCGMEEHVHDETCYEQAGTLKSESTDHMTTELKYDAGEVHQNTVLSAEKLEGAKEAEVVSLIEKQLSENEEIDNARSYSIRLVNNEQEVAPEGEINLSMSFAEPVKSEIDADEVDWKLFYIDETNAVHELNDTEKVNVQTNTEYAVQKIDLETSSLGKYVLVGITSVQPSETEVEEADTESDVNEAAESKSEDSLKTSESETADDTEPVNKKTKQARKAPAQTANATSGMEVKKVTIKVNGNVVDPDTTTIKSTDTLNISLDYTIAPGTLSDEQNSVTYKLPDGIKIKNESSGYITDGNTDVGTYVIKTDGTMVFTYYDDYVQRNAGDEQTSGQQIQANATFNASVNEDSINDDNKLPLAFEDGPTITINVEKEIPDVGDLTVAKSASEPNLKEGYIDYTVKVSSTAGTSKEVLIKDEITNSGIDITKIDQLKISPEVSSKADVTENGFTWNVPAMNENSSYTITYRVHFNADDIPADGVSIGNKVEAESETSKGTKLKPNQSISTEVKPKTLEKSGKYNQETDQITWTIKLNQDQINLKGWTLQDTFNGTALTGEVQISPSVDGKTSIKLPYTFKEDDRTTYTITYTTSADQQIGNSTAYNKAELTRGPDGDDGKITTGDVPGNGSPWRDYNPLEKSAKDIEADENGKTAVVSWTVDISATYGDITADWVYKDVLWNGQWFTGKQLKSIKAAIDQSIEGLDLTYTMKANLQKDMDVVGDEVDFGQIADEAKYKVYTLYFSKPLMKGQKIHYEYQSTAPIEGLTSETTFRNSAYVESNGKQVSDHGEIKYTPPENPNPTIDKKDGNEQGDTSHTISSETDTFDWDISLRIPKSYEGGELKVLEQLPEGVEVTYFEIVAQDIFGVNDIKEAGDHKIDSFTINTAISQDGRNYTITIPEDLVKHEKISEIRFVVRVKVKDGFEWEKDSKGYQVSKFDNAVTLIDKDNLEIGSDHQGQTITVNDGKKLLAKSVTNISKNYSTETAVDRIDYSIEVNPEGSDLIKNSDKIYLTDIVSYEWNPWDLMLVSYARNSIHVYNRNPDGSRGTEISSNDYSFTYEESSNDMNAKSTATRTLKLTLPDEKPLIVDYSYIARLQSGEVNRWPGIVSNKVRLEGYSDEKDSSEKSVSILISDSSASASIEGIVLRKVDADNYNKQLTGAQFKLYKYDRTTDSYVDTGKTYDVDSKGSLSFTTDDITYETAYKLEEITAPEGYLKRTEPFYFVVTKVTLKPGETPVYTAPSDFNGSVYEAGKSFYFENEKIPENGLKVRKKWVDANGIEITDQSTLPGSVTVALYKNGQNTGKTLTLSKDNSWTDTFKDLDADGIYTIVEVNVPDGYETPGIVYEQNGSEVDVVNGSKYGEATITNKKATKSLQIKKEWINEYGVVTSGPDGVDEIKVAVKDGEETVARLTLNAKNNWSAVVNDLDKLTVYSVEEEDISGYTQLEIRYIDEYGNVHSGATSDTVRSIISNQKNQEQPLAGTTNLLVRKKWVNTDGTSELTGADLKNLTADVEIVRYKAEQQGTKVHFIRYYNGNAKSYSEVGSIVVKKDSPIEMRISASDWNAPLYVTSNWPINNWSDGFYRVEQTGEKIGTVNNIDGQKTAVYNFNTDGLSDIYLVGYADDSWGVFDVIDLNDITIPENQQGEVGEYSLDQSYQGPKITLDSGNNWCHTFKKLPLSGVEDEKMYFYRYAVRENSASDGFTFESFSTGQSGVDNTNIPISNPGDLVVITNKKKEAFELPKTGGSGTIKFILGGISLMMIAMLLYLQMMRKNLRKEAYKGNRHK